MAQNQNDEAQIIGDLQNMIVEVLNLEDFAPEDIDPDEDLFSRGGMGLDSIDALELGVALKERFGFSLADDKPDLTAQLKTVRVIAKKVALAQAHAGENKA